MNTRSQSILKMNEINQAAKKLLMLKNSKVKWQTAEPSRSKREKLRKLQMRDVITVYI